MRSLKLVSFVLLFPPRFSLSNLNVSCYVLHTFYGNSQSVWARSAEGLHNRGEISPRSWLAIVLYYVNFTTLHLHYAPTCELAHCNSWTRCQKLVPDIHKNESPFRSLLEESYNELWKESVRVYPILERCFEMKNGFLRKRSFTRFFIFLLFIRNECTSTSTRYAAFRNCVRTKISKSIIKRCRWDSLPPPRG